MTSRFHSWDLSSINQVYCVGRNYADHAKELNNPVPVEPVIFSKSRTCLVPFSGVIELPASLGRVDYETELAVRIEQPLFQCEPHEVSSALGDVAVALDLTRRELQNELKTQGKPWCLAKSFLNACPLSRFLAANTFVWDDLSIRLEIDGVTRQHGYVKDMLFAIESVVAYIAQTMPLVSGDVILTGTPAGVGAVHDGQQLKAWINDQLMAEAIIKR